MISVGILLVLADSLRTDAIMLGLDAQSCAARALVRLVSCGMELEHDASRLRYVGISARSAPSGNATDLFRVVANPAAGGALLAATTYKAGR